jgi:soluble lytic murein transglycosylase
LGRAVFVLGSIAIAACTPNLAIEPLPLDIQEEATDTGAHPQLLPEIETRHADSEPLRIEPVDAYPTLRKKLRSIRPKRVQQGLEEIERVDTIFPDRVAVLEGQALERLDELEGARAAYLKALREANAPAVREQAARGMISVLGKIGAHSGRLEYIDALLEELGHEPDWELTILRAESLHELDRTDEAQDALRSVLAAYPNPTLATRAERALLSMSGKKKLSKADDRSQIFGKVRWMERTGKSRQGQRLLSQWRRKQKKLDAEALLLEADLVRNRGHRWQSQAMLQPLAKSRIPELRSGAMLRLARLSALAFRYPKARQEFAKVMDDFPGSPDAIAAEFEAAQLEYDSDEYSEASLKMRAFTEHHPNDKLAPKAHWLAGFSAHLAGTSSIAIACFERFLAAEPSHPTAVRARYWLARELELLGERERAGEMYAAITEQTPLGYYGLLAEKRLHGMGVSAALYPLPAVPSPGSVEEVAKLLGPGRPLGVDRAASLFAANLKREGVEELVGLAEHFRKSGDTQGATLVVDLFQIFGKESWAFLLARQIAEADDPDDLERRPYYWRVWRHAFPTPFEDEVRTASGDNELDPFLVYAVMRTESLFRPDSVSAVGARGLMQLMPATARWIGRRDKRARPHSKRYSRPDANIWLGTWYVRYLLDHYQGDVARALGAYNAGPAAIDRWSRRFGGMDPDEFNERIPYDETRAYVRRAMESYLVYQRLHPQPFVAQTEEPAASGGS